MKFCNDFHNNEIFGSFGLQKDKNALEKEAGTVVCVLEVPVLAYSDSVTANLILNWTHPGSQTAYKSVLLLQEVEEEDQMEGDSGRVYTRSCGNVTLNSKDIIDARYELNFSAALEVEDGEMEDFKGNIHEKCIICVLSLAVFTTVV